ncbi:MAG: DUF2779 domain-containing protein [Dehalococcoidales bacterium]|nr:DUF2779 domain-containing protein [Dehalococcoidales bacterium]
MPSAMLSKTKYLNGLQCFKLLWIYTNQPESIPQPDAATQNRFDQGHLAGELAKKLFPGGIDIPQDDFIGNISRTKELLKQRKTLFEAGVLTGKLYSRADILNPVNEDEWDIIEVKSSTEVKDINIQDVSFQKFCREKDGLKIRKCFLAHINNKYVKNGEINPEELFTIEDITEEVISASEGITDRIISMFDVISSPVCPEMSISTHCSDPYDCPLSANCRQGLPEHNVFTLYRGGKKGFDLYNSGILSITDIPSDYDLSDKQLIQCSCVVGGEPHIEKNELMQFLASLEYPLYYLDFETFSTVVPMFDGTRPYQNIPFQFSLHVQDMPGSSLQHHWFLADGPGDPRPGLLSQLHKSIGEFGSVIVYNQSFEKGILREMGEALQEYTRWSQSVIDRIVDLYAPFRSFCYYHPSQKGSASIKKVLPALTGSGYEDLAIAKGDDASLVFLDMTYSELTDEECLEIRNNLLAYCGLDTEGMVRIVEQLYKLI